MSSTIILSLYILLLVTTFTTHSLNTNPHHTNPHLIKLLLTRTHSDISKLVLEHTSPHQKQPLTGNSGQGYCVAMFVGTPPQQFNILVDTGSSNFAIASLPHPFVHHHFNTSLSSTFTTNHRFIRVPYTQGEWSGYIGRDIVGLHGLGSVMAEVSMITTSKGFFLPGAGWQGIWGLGYEEISMSADGSGGQKSLWKRLVEEKGVEDAFSLAMHGDTGYMTLGGVDMGDVDGEVYWATLRKEWYYEVVVVDVVVGSVALKLPCKEYNFNKAIVDSGTTNLHFPPTAFHTIVHHLQEYVPQHTSKLFWQGKHSLCLQESVFSTLPDITISLLSHPSSSSSSSNSSSSSSSKLNSSSSSSSYSSSSPSSSPPSSSSPSPSSSNLSSSSSPPSSSSSSPPSPPSYEIINLVITPRQYLKLISINDHFLYDNTNDNNDNNNDDNNYNDIERLFTEATDMITSPTNCYRLSISPSPAGTIIGAVVMEGYVTVFDRVKKRVGFGRAKKARALKADVFKLRTNKDVKECMYERPGTFINIAYAYYASFTICFIVVVIFTSIVLQKEFFPSKQEVLEK